MTQEVYALDGDPNERIEEPEVDYSDAEAFVREEIHALHVGAQADFRVTDERSADWVAAKIQGWEREREARKAAFIQMDTKLKRKIEWFTARFGLELEEFAMQQLMGINANREKPVKSITLPCGVKLGYRQQPEAIEIEDELKYVDWVINNHPDVITDYVPKIDKKALVKIVFKDGTPPDGASLRAPYDKFYIKT